MMVLYCDSGYIHWSNACVYSCACMCMYIYIHMYMCMVCMVLCGVVFWSLCCENSICTYYPAPQFLVKIVNAHLQCVSTC